MEHIIRQGDSAQAIVTAGIFGVHWNRLILATN